MSTFTPPDQAQIVTNALSNQIAQQTKVYLNLGQETIVITEDKVRLCLMTHLKRLEAARQWIAPAGILATILVTFASSTFHDYIFDASTWRALFIFSVILSLGWLIHTIRAAWKAPSIEDVVADMKQAGEQKSNT